MSAFLWVEDFEGGQYREFAFKLFGEALGIPAHDFSDTETGLKQLLKKNDIYLATNFADGLRFINDESERKRIDYVVLDIDLALMGPDISDDEPLIRPVLESWYNYKPADANEEESFNRACDELKRVAGYHLYVDLVVNLRFPRDRILFCSNHGGYLKAIQDSFNGAKIKPPAVLTKSDPALSHEVSAFYADEYSHVRRIILAICDELSDALRFKQAEFTMAKVFKNSEDTLKATDGAYFLGVLPHLLPAYLNDDTEIRLVYRQLVRALTQEFVDKVDYEGMPKNKKPFVRVLHTIRNWTSHDSRALNNLDASDVAYIFYLFIQTGFSIKTTVIESVLGDLLNIIGRHGEIDHELLNRAIINSIEDVSQRGDALSDEAKSIFYQERTPFGLKVNLLSQNSCLFPGEQKKFIYQIFWHNIVTLNDTNSLSPQSTFFSNDGAYAAIKQLSHRIFNKSFVV
ncbi:MAG: hypothetical protein PHV02_00165 [Rhodocyclaceae bacterium]|nr:hypothetical protein [Rhodocyclaceae bacterium]